MQKNETFPNFIESLFVVIAIFIIEYLLYALSQDIRNNTGMKLQDFDGVIILFGYGIVFSFILYYKNMSYRTLFHSSRSSIASTIILLVVPIILITPALTLFLWTSTAVLTSLLPPPDWYNTFVNRMMSNGVESVITVCILAPILEEMLFRGVILRSFLHQYSKRNAIIFSALIFGLAHLNIYQFIIGLVAGYILGWLYERTHSLWPGILLHSTYNSSCILLYQALPAQDIDNYWEPSPTHWVISFGFAAIGTILLRRILSPTKPPITASLNK
ncbi:lysostaphin resistance A-like protein [Chitinimonas sp. PSY-7]|uniref:CPBP family glutamic-type intramembrane protease n=1 Tax=Chitinimonas sp. PSY-7 TaxID=3459088 RepID=UPI0040403C90